MKSIEMKKKYMDQPRNFFLATPLRWSECGKVQLSEENSGNFLVKNWMNFLGNSLINILNRGAMDFVGENRGASKVQEVVHNAASDTRLNQPSRVPDVKSSKRDLVDLPSLPNPGKKPCYFLVIYVFSKCYVFPECCSCFKRHHFR